MPSLFKFSKSSIQYLEGLWKEGSAQALSEFFSSTPDASWLDNWLRAKLTPVSTRGQYVLRAARATRCYGTCFGDLRQLLVAWPVAASSTIGVKDWSKTKAAAEGGLSLALAELGATVQLCARPVSCASLQAQGLSRMRNLMESLRLGREPALSAGSAAEVGPLVWVARICTSASGAAELERLFFAMNHALTKLTRPICLRMEALMEEEGVLIKVFPPTALWNGLSLSRLTYARLVLNTARKTKGPWHATREGSTVRVVGPAGEVLNQDFPEEVNQDLLPLFEGWVDSPELHLEAAYIASDLADKKKPSLVATTREG